MRIETPLISVLIDTYNYGRFIEEAIESVVSQDFPTEKMEILVVDDGSTDDTPERVKKYGKKIRYLRKENGGQASAFNCGFAKAQGEIVVMLDADDYFLPGKVRRVVEEFEKNPETGTIYHALVEFHEGPGELRESKLGFTPISGRLFDENGKLFRFRAHQTSCLAFRRSVINRLLPIPESLRVHADAFIELLAVLFAPVLAISEPLAVYRVHGENLTYSNWVGTTREAVSRRYADYVTVLNEVKTWVKVHKEELRGIAAERYVDRQLVELQQALFRVDPPGRLRYFLFLLKQNQALSSDQSRKFTAFNYLSAALALVFDYEEARARNRKVLHSMESLWKRGRATY